MIKHVVMWRLKESVHGNNKKANARLIKKKLESLNGKMPGMLLMEDGINLVDEEFSSDIVLYAEFGSRQALEVYQNHPDHKLMKSYIYESRSERREVDYEVLHFPHAKCPGNRKIDAARAG